MCVSHERLDIFCIYIYILLACVQTRPHVQWPGALLGGLFASWVRTLESDAGVGAERGKRNLQTLGALIYLGCQKKYEPWHLIAAYAKLQMDANGKILI